MNQILTIFRHEWAIKRRSAVLTLLFIILQTLLLVALLTGWSQNQQTLKQQQAAQALVEKQWNEQPSRHPHRVAHFGHFTFRPPSALAFFDNGVNVFTGSSIFIEAHKQNSANFANDKDSDTLLRFSQLSVANILLLFWPLLLLAMGYNAVSAERQSGTLRQLLSLNIPLSHLLLGKGLCYLVISIVFISPVFVATMALIGLSETAFADDTMLRIGMLLLLYLTYCLVWIAMILGVSSLVSAPRHSLSLLISLWFVLTILMPRLLADIAAQQYPQLSRNAFESEIKQQVSKIGNSHNADDPHFNEFKQKTLTQYGVDKVEDLPVNYRALVIQEGERISSAIYTAQYRKQMAQQQAQHKLLSAFYWLNPYLLARDLSMAIAASDVWHFYDYELQSEAHRFARISKLNNIHAEHVDAANDWGSTVESSHWRDFNAFEYQPVTIAQSIKPFGGFWFVSLFHLLLVCLMLSNNGVKRRVYALA